MANVFSEDDLKEYGFTERELDMVDFPELEDATFNEEVPNDESRKYELLFASEQDYEDFTNIIKKIKMPEKSISDSLLQYLKDNV